MPPLTTTHGPVWQLSKHQWAPATGTAPPVLNDAYAVPRVFPEIALDRVNGWRSSPELDDRRAPRTVGVGEVPYPSRTLGKLLVYEGRIVARGTDTGVLAVLEKQMAFVTGFANMDGEGTMTVTPWTAPYGGTVWTFTARVMGWDFDPNWEVVGGEGAFVEWPFRLTLRMSDPRFYTGGVGYW